MATAYSTTNSIKKAYVPLGAPYGDAVSELITVVGATAASEERIVDGTLFLAGDYTTGLAYNTGVSILIQNGANDGLYLLSTILSSMDCKVEVYETPTFSAAGSAVTARNLNRTSSKVLGATITKNPTVSVDGTQIGPIIMNQANVKSTLLDNVIILAPSTNYYIKITNVSNNVGIINTILELYQPNL